MDVNPHTLSLQQTLKGVESKLAFLGNGPHTTQQAEEFQTLTTVKQRLLQQIQVSVQGTPSQSAPMISSDSVESSVPTSTVAAITAAAQTPTSHSNKPHQVMLSKPQPPPISQTFMTPAPVKETSNKILDKHRLHELVKEIDPMEQLDEDVEEMLMTIADDFIESVVSASCSLAKHRKSNTLEVKDLKLHLEKQWNITVPGYGADEIRPFKKTMATDAHKQRLALIRKATKK